jgi:hypothetical protein
MILSNKDQCKSCKEFGRVKGLEGWCCFGTDDEGVTHCDIVSKRSNCWCLDWKPNDRPFQPTVWHDLGKYFTERYGKNVRLTPVDADGFKYGVKNLTEFRVEIESDKLIIPVSAVFAISGRKVFYSFGDIKQILMNYEVK